MRDELLFFFIQNLYAGPTATDYIFLTHLYMIYIYLYYYADFVVSLFLIFI